MPACERDGSLLWCLYLGYYIAVRLPEEQLPPLDAPPSEANDLARKGRVLSGRFVMKRFHILLLLLVACFATAMLAQMPATWTDPAAHKSGFVTANGIRLHYLDWGGSGPPLILIHGLGQSPHFFDDLAPAFTDR